MMISGSRKVYTALVRARRQLKLALYVCTVIACYVVVWDPSIVDPLIEAFLPTATKPTQRPSLQPTPHPLLPKLVHLPFVLNDHKCEDLFDNAGFNFTYSEDFWDHVDAYKSFLSVVGMLPDSNVDEQTWVYHELAKMPSIKTICDVGFGTGHRAFYCLAGRFDVNLHSFEENFRNYTYDLEIFMAGEFPFQFFSHFGDLRAEISKFFTENNTTKCDLVFLDSSLGARTMRYLIDKMRTVVNPEQHFVILDAHPRYSKRGSIESWEAARKQGTIVENFRCSLKVDEQNPMRRPDATGFLLGHFTHT